MLQVEQSVTTPLEHLESVVQPFNKAAIVLVDEIVENFLPPATRMLMKGSKQCNPLLAMRLIQARILVLAATRERC